MDAWRDPGNLGNRTKRGSIGCDSPLLPAGQTRHELAFPIGVVLRSGYLTKPNAAHDLTDRNRREIRRCLVDPRAVGRIE